MKFIKYMFTLIIIIGISVLLMAVRPTEEDFVEWYVERNHTNLGSFFDEAFELVVKARTETQDYLIFSVFKVDGKDYYVGICNHIFGQSSVEQVSNTLEELVDQALSATEDKGN